MKPLERYYSLLGISSDATIKEVKTAFRRKSYSLHPDKHPGNPNAFAQFNEINEAFVEIVKDFENQAMQAGNEDPEVASVMQRCEECVPGEVDVKGNTIAIKVQHFKLWRKVLRLRFPDAVVGSQRKNSISNLKQQVGGKSKGTRFIIHFRAKGASEETKLSKVYVTVYENENIVVTGPSYFIWTLDNYKDLANQVQEMWQEQFQEVNNGDNSVGDPSPSSGEGECCQRDFNKLLNMLQDIDEKLSNVTDRMDQMAEGQGQLNKLVDQRYREMEKNIDQLQGQIVNGDLLKTRINDTGLSEITEGGKTYLIPAKDRFEELEEWFKDFCKSELPSMLNNQKETKLLLEDSGDEE